MYMTPLISSVYIYITFILTTEFQSVRLMVSCTKHTQITALVYDLFSSKYNCIKTLDSLI